MNQESTGQNLPTYRSEPWRLRNPDLEARTVDEQRSLFENMRLHLINEHYVATQTR